MKFCPKCRSFYDDEYLRFCLEDGVPLIVIDQTNEIWSEGTESVRKGLKKIRSENRRQQIKRMVSIMVTTILAIMVVSVIVINSLIYINGRGDEVADNIPPAAEPSYMPAPEKTAEPETGTSPEAVISPTPTPEPVASPIPSPLATMIAPTPEITSTPMPPITQTPTPNIVVQIKCSDEMRRINEQKARMEHESSWRGSFLSGSAAFLNSQRPALAKTCETRFPNNLRGCTLIVERATATLADTASSVSITSDKDCKTVQATVAYQWMIATPQSISSRVIQTLTFTYPIK